MLPKNCTIRSLVNITVNDPDARVKNRAWIEKQWNLKVTPTTHVIAATYYLLSQRLH